MFFSWPQTLLAWFWTDEWLDLDGSHAMRFHLDKLAWHLSLVDRQQRNFRMRKHACGVSMSRPLTVSITKVVSAVYCEQKVVFDREYGDLRPQHVKAKAEEGIREHAKFEFEGRVKQATDSRCFIASHVYGLNAPETNALREWRDRRLMPLLVGRWVVRVYYFISPLLLRLAGRSSVFSKLAKVALDVFVGKVGGK